MTMSESEYSEHSEYTDEVSTSEREEPQGAGSWLGRWVAKPLMVLGYAAVVGLVWTKVCFTLLLCVSVAHVYIHS